MSRVGPPGDLLRRLADPGTAEEAARALIDQAAWLTGPPPAELVTALGEPENSYAGMVVRLARAWQRTALVPALIQALRGERDLERRRRLAWTIKQAPAEEAVPALLAIAADATEDPIVRRYAIEAVKDCTFTRSDGWTAVEAAAHALVRDPDPLIRDAAAALIGLGEGRDEERRALLVGMLADPDDTVVATAAWALRRYGLAVTDIPAELASRLLGHPNPRVRLGVQELLAGG